ncbi:MAG: hypothetical protein EXR79_10790 [Myxococcales bacterium]|nr:hypothetical protein [Myxococcales bacterium]
MGSVGAAGLPLRIAVRGNPWADSRPEVEARARRGYPVPLRNPASAEQESAPAMPPIRSSCLRLVLACGWHPRAVPLRVASLCAVAGALVLAGATAGCLETEFEPEPATPVADVARGPDVPDTGTATTPDTVADAPLDSADSSDAPSDLDGADALADAAQDAQDDADADDTGPDPAPDLNTTPDVAVADTGPVSLPTGATCTLAADCTGGLCLQVTDAVKVCSEACTGDCPDGTRCAVAPLTGSTAVHYCLPLPGHLCQPCKVDADCPGGACIDGGNGEPLCTVACGADAGDCPAGFVCQSFVQKGERCVPQLGTCTCGSAIVGNAWACAVAIPELGACVGVQKCQTTGWDKCDALVPGLEKCNALDDDCDGQTDESFTALGSACGVGACAGGKVICNPDKKDPKPTACSTAILKAKKETCNDGKDNDCNGQTDEQCPPKDTDGDKTPDPKDCAPYDAGTYPGAKEGCCAVLPGQDKAVPVPADDKTKACDKNCDGKVTACAPKDKDGDGYLAGTLPGEDCNDNDATIRPGAPDKCGDGIDQDCAGGDLKCDPDLDSDKDDWLVGAGDCDDDAKAINPGQAELCNSIDDDCDGLTDEGNPGGGVKCGPDVGACKPGTTACVHLALSAQVTCTDAVGGEAETCNTKDDDCDGKTDEDWLDLSKKCDTDDADQCENGALACSADGLGTTCGNESKTDLVEQCKVEGGPNAADENCNGQTDEVCFGKDVDGDGAVAPDDCQELDSAFHPKAKEGCCPVAIANSPQANQVCDKNCDKQVTPCEAGDLDGDGFTGVDDCNESDPRIRKDAPEKCGDTIDQDCDEKDLECAGIADDDDDGYANPQDCGPFNKAINPGADELCNNKDDDCDGVIDEGNPGAKPGPCGSSDGLCVPGQEACVHVAAKALLLCVPKVGPIAELCNGLDDNCNGKTDEYFYSLGKKCDGKDLDKCENGTVTCSADFKSEVCANEKVTDIYELCNGVDDDCNGQTDEGQAYFGSKVGAKCKGLGVCGEGIVVCSLELQVAVCSTDAYGTESQALVETCNGQDDDCDGLTDEGQTFAGLPKGVPCIGNGQCGKTAGVVQCPKVPGPAICSTMLGGSAYQGKAELCNGIDDNCDGHVDEGLLVKDSTCKKVGLCSDQNVKAVCTGAQWTCNYDAVQGYQGATEILCDGVDNDCDGGKDEDFQVGQACDGTDTDLCANGKVVCSADKLTGACGTETAVDLVEQCNAKDDDCDGKTDEDFAIGEACDGGDSDSCKHGTWTCATDGKKNECVNEAKENLTEVCNGQDDDCDGTTDEEWKALGEACDGGDGDKCKNGVIECSKDTKSAVCGTEDPDNVVEVCDGADNDCNEKLDDGLAPYKDLKLGDLQLGVVCNGIGGCGQGKVVCAPKDKTLTCSTNPNAYLIFEGKELCDGIDNDCNGQTDDALQWKGNDLKAACPGLGECGAGKVECGTDKQVTCSTLKNGSSSQAKAEACDNKDNDCDGETDEELGLEQSPCLKVGVCAVAGKVQAVCSAAKWACDYKDVPDFEATEKLCDGKDNDCDGQTDEGFDIGKACDGDDDDMCATGKWTCTGNGKDHECKNEQLTNIPEVCDGADNDCDGGTDEDFDYFGQKLGETCKGFGACGSGKVVCSKSNQIATCSTNPDGPASQGKPEACNTVDDDCNGKTDDGIKFEGLPVGAPCSGIGECGLGAVTCVNLKPVCSTNPDGSASAAKPEQCNAKDDDCDSKTDEDLDPKKSTCNVTGVCLQALAAKCADGAWACSYLCCGYEPKEMLCDGKDNDCNGATDESYATKGKPCDGPDVDKCKTGEFICAPNQAALVCGPEVGGAAPEACNGKDDDCNDQTDEAFPELLQACDGSDKDECPNGSWTCSPDGKSVQCVNEFPKNIVEVCDFKDNDCDGKTDEDTDLGLTCDGNDNDKCKNGTFTCGESGKVECVNESKTNLPELCNSKDDDCDGVNDNGFEQKGLKCDVSTDNDACATGSLQCTAAGTMACLGDFACVAGTTCKDSGKATLMDQCTCGSVGCSTSQGSACSSGTCTCNGGPACGFGSLCQASGCK